MVKQIFIVIIPMVAGIILPLFNIPLIIKVIKQKSSNELSMVWALGVWTCFALMLPAAMMSDDIVFKAFSIVNITMFSGVVAVVLKYHKRP